MDKIFENVISLDKAKMVEYCNKDVSEMQKESELYNMKSIKINRSYYVTIDNFNEFISNNNNINLQD